MTKRAPKPPKRARLYLTADGDFCGLLWIKRGQLWNARHADPSEPVGMHADYVLAPARKKASKKR